MQIVSTFLFTVFFSLIVWAKPIIRQPLFTIDGFRLGETVTREILVSRKFFLVPTKEETVCRWRNSTTALLLDDSTLVEVWSSSVYLINGNLIRLGSSLSLAREKLEGTGMKVDFYRKGITLRCSAEFKQGSALRQRLIIDAKGGKIDKIFARLF